MTSVAKTSSELLALQNRIQTLTELTTRLQSLRKVPTHLFRPPVHAANATAITISPSLHPRPQPYSPDALRDQFQEVKGFAEIVRSEKVQEALVFARDSEEKDKSDLELSVDKRRQNRKRKRQPTPESPRPYVSFQPQQASLFPPADTAVSPVTLEGLLDFFREYNKTNPKIKIQLVSSDPRRNLQCPVLVRFLIRDVVTIFLMLDLANDASLIVENATAFAPREQKPPHSHSDYAVYQRLSQQVIKMIQSQPQVPLRTVLNLLASYEDLFAQRCISCQRILSAEAHVPAVARIWVECAPEGGKPGWEPWHPTCLQR